MNNDIKKPAGRPRKVIGNMDSVVQQVVEETQQVIEKPTHVMVDTVNGPMRIELQRTALGLGQNEKGQWCLYVFDFNPLTKQATFKEVRNETSQSGASLRFKMMASNFLK